MKTACYGHPAIPKELEMEEKRLLVEMYPRKGTVTTERYREIFQRLEEIHEEIDILIEEWEKDKQTRDSNSTLKKD